MSSHKKSNEASMSVNDGDQSGFVSLFLWVYQSKKNVHLQNKKKTVKKIDSL